MAALLWVGRDRHGVLVHVASASGLTEEFGSGSGAHLFRYDATGLRGRRMRSMNDMPASDAGWPQEALIGITDVICLDDTPSVLYNLRVHPVGRPDIVAVVEFSQLGVYDDQQ
ncbi:hypothetical protein HMPREF0591_1436 [Mycobacterium parascrofulaceum ATCC BAA-614]|uniref:Uncharacterized protein n=1 Tax=Mycobacterium parascrofulaceum ATCC BAA-614 TaxID=525368 RepID=D5P5J2_9MYCO|nr:hypothetical protein [Mycobacterium parascrofulaceum]EFG78669.1 hypothetical protein HMPREF0591_1436 [Mycobacterium parascrofulaceum ATCC BAA-614]